jgi:hypothetical protein
MMNYSEEDIDLMIMEGKSFVRLEPLTALISNTSGVRNWEVKNLNPPFRSDDDAILPLGEPIPASRRRY